MRTGRMKRGFTLIETVVTVGIVAAMAAVVIPQVAKQFDAADPTRIQNDLKNLQTAVETFNVNVKAMPGDLDDLMNTIAITEDSSLTTAASGLPTFTAAQVALWQGPYADQSILDLADTDAKILTGYGASILDSFVCYASTNNQHGVSEGSAAGATADDVACPGTGTGQRFLAFQITGITCSTAAGSVYMNVNELFDGVGETNAATAGRVRCETAAATGTDDTDVDVVWFLAVPIG